ncbi:hypothetical protein BLOT_000417, partial [Blomia tropicalis]
FGNTNADQCLSCQKIFNFISNVTHNGDESLKAKLSDLCSEYSFMPGKQTKIWCGNAIDNFFNMINNNLNTSSVCYDINACEDKSGIREIYFSENKQDCDFCIFVTTRVKEILSGGPTEVELKTMFEDGCHYLKSFENECLQMVDQYVDDLITFVNETFQPSQMCKSLNVCSSRTGPLSIQPEHVPSPSELVNILPVNFTLSNKTMDREDIDCIICKKIVKIIQTQLKNNATDEQIVNVLTDVCELAPSKDRDNCKAVVTNYADRLIQVLTQDIDSNLACTLVGLCVPQSFYDYINGNYINNQKKPNEDVSAKKNMACVECQLITHFIQNELYNYKNEEQIEEFIMNHFCKKMSLFLNENSCDTFIQEYGPIIMQTIAQEIFDPTTFCYAEIHVCPKKLDSNKNTEPKCEICKNIVKSLGQAESRDHELDKLTEKACDHLSRPSRVECGLMMKAFAPYIFDMMNHNDNAAEICKSIDICMVPGHVHLLGGSKCTYGPTYWCHTEAHADACNASTYCRQKVWKAIN